MLALLCDTCRKPIEHEGFELTLMPGAVVSGPNESTGSPPARPA